MPLLDSWIADRTRRFDSSGIRRMFDLARNLKDPVNLSIGQPDFALTNREAPTLQKQGNVA